ncbi:MAG: hypothetical protein V2J65_27975 [Desulfobacteraceae bacterium]|nr:hypothetical protein [Desulfobacteraceae bacterium]
MRAAWGKYLPQAAPSPPFDASPPQVPGTKPLPYPRKALKDKGWKTERA